jgi:hypothetical protein
VLVKTEMSLMRPTGACGTRIALPSTRSPVRRPPWQYIDNFDSLRLGKFYVGWYISLFVDDRGNLRCALGWGGWIFKLFLSTVE